MSKSISKLIVAGMALALAVPVGANAQQKAVARHNTGNSVTSVAKQMPEGKHLQLPKGLATSRTLLDKGGAQLAKAGKFSRPVSFKLDRKNAPLRAAGGESINGVVIYSDAFTQESQPTGVYSIPIDGSSNELTEIAVVTEMYGAMSGVKVGERYYTSTLETFFGLILGAYVSAYDTNTWELVQVVDCTSDMSAVATAYAYDAATETIYGQFLSSDGANLIFGTFDPETYTVTPIAVCSEQYNVLTFATDGTLYAISMSGSLYTVNKDNGNLTLIGNTGYATSYYSGGVYDPATNMLYWNICSDPDSYMAAVNVDNAETTLLYQLALNEEIIGMWSNNAGVEPGAPGKATDMVATFADGSLTGSVSFKAPTTLYDGSALTGDVNYVLQVNGEDVQNGTVAAGGTVTYDYTAPAAGTYRFSVYFTNAAGKGQAASVSLYLGVDSALAPTNVALNYNNDKMTLTWDAVKGAHLGYLGNVTYTVTRYESGKDPVVVKEGITDCTYTEDFVYNEAALANVYYTVAAVTTEGTTQATASNSVSLGYIIPAYTHSFVGDADLTGYTIIDANGDNKAWAITADGLRMSYNGSIDMDDWCISPAVMLEAGNYYTYTVVVANNSGTYVETVEVKAGATPTAEGMTFDVIPATDVCTNGADMTLTGGFAPAETGKYYFGIHGISQADMFYLYVREYSISEGVNAMAPAKVSDVEIEVNPATYLEATLSFKAPTTNLVGETIETIDWIEVSRDGQEIHRISNPAPGAELKIIDIVSESATYNYSIVAHGNYGYGLPVELSAYVGVPVAAAVENAEVAETATPGEVTISWDAVTTAADGSSLASEFVTYTIIDKNGNVVAEGLTDCSYTYQAVTEDQDFVQYGIYAVTAGGMSDITATNMIPAGTPYELPFKESFNDGGISYIWGTESLGAEWAIATNEQFTDVTDADQTGGFAYMNGSTLDAAADLFSGLIKLDATAPAIKFAYYNIVGDDTNEIEVYVTCEGVKTLVSTVVMNQDGAQEGWNTAFVSLKDYAGKNVYVTFRGIVKKYIYTMIDNIVIDQLQDYDMQLVSVSGPAEVHPDEEFAITADVINMGALPMADYTVELYNNGNLVATKEGVALETGEKATFSFDQVLNITASESNVYTVTLVCELDENKEDNTLEYPVIVLFNNYPAPTALKATKVNNGVNLTWNEPDTENGAPVAQITEDFESYDAFATDNIGDWTLVDEDNAATGGVQGVQFGDIIPGETPVAYFVMNNTEYAGNAAYLAHSGNQYLVSTFLYDANNGASADWLISPLLSGDAQTITFYAKSFSGDYPETFKVLYSTTDTDITNFTEVAEYANISTEWTAYSFNVPAGTKYFAIECVSYDKFMLFIDDITYAPAGGEGIELSIVGYNVYRNGIKINDAPIAETSYFDADGTTSDFYCVTAVYTIGESVPSLTVGVGGQVGVTDMIGGVTAVKVVNRSIVITNAQGNVAVYAADGKAIYSEAAAKTNTVTVTPGVYVVKAGETVTKVIVK